ncbi:putative neutral sphingomyelinase [Tubulanus polymorphus]|uniref:putative neutral sphingomyelinase n=1 Tax=Tubulanus polymorphus TaxID=672921 RepID=UPI003DA594C3
MKTVGGNLKILTLNCWGLFVPFVCQKRRERMTAIAARLSEGEHDIVMLQEVWSQSDYEMLCKRITPAYAYTHYFHSNFIGSGTCVFSKYPIYETFYHRYPVNGHAHRIQHGDWYGGKGVGLCKIVYNGVRINLYVTHLHAEYSTSNDEYLAHRVVQAFDMSQFVKTTSETCDVVIAGGDFNSRPTDCGYSLLVTNASLKDAWLNQRETPSGGGETSDTPSNPFTCKKHLMDFPLGERLDYLMYRANASFSVDCARCYLTMGRVPREQFSYSDHEGVAAELEIKRNITAMGAEIDFEKRKEHLNRALRIVQSGFVQCKNERLYFAVYFVVACAVLAMLGFTSAPYGLAIVCGVLRVYFTLLMAYAAWVVLIIKPAEENALWNAKKDMSNLIAQEKLLSQF